MTSPVDTSVKFFTNKMVNAPVLTKSVGSLIALLDACLVLGFDTKAATSVNIANGVATVAFPGEHSAEPHTVILVSGATGSYTALNGEQKVVSKGVGTLTFATNVAAGTAAGTISFKMAPAGWEKTYSAGDIGVYRSKNVESSRMYLRVEDSGLPEGPGFARVRAFETMTDANTGLRPFPSDQDLVNSGNPFDGRGGYWTKGYSAGQDTVPIQWEVFADSRMFYYCPAGYSGENPNYQHYEIGPMLGFGDPVARRLGGDPYSAVLGCGRNYQDAQSYPPSMSFDKNMGDSGRFWFARDWTGMGTARRTRPWAYGMSSGTVSGQSDGLGAGIFPNPVDGSLVYIARHLRSGWDDTIENQVPRAGIPGIYSILQNRVYPLIKRGTLVPGSGATAGRILYGRLSGEMTSDPIANPTSTGVSLVDVTGPWR